MARKKHTPNDPERRQRILDATIALLEGGGAPAVSARAVANRAGVPVGSVSYHFASVRALLLEAARHVAEAREASLREWSRQVTPETVIARVAELIHTQITSGRSLTIVAYELYLLGLRDEGFRRLSVEATSVLARELAAHVPPGEAWRFAAVADGVQLHSLFLEAPPSVAELADALCGRVAMPR